MVLVDSRIGGARASHGVITTWNAGAHRVKGYTADEIWGDTSPSSRETVKEIRAIVLDPGASES